jgi:two-component system response regulator AtoC
MALAKILIVDDEKLIREFLLETLKRHDYEVIAVENGKKAFQALENTTFDLVITDMKMPDFTGIEVLKKAKAASPATVVIVITAYASIENAVEAMRLGAFNYLIKPFTPETIETVLEKAKEHLNLVEENRYLRDQASIPAKSLSGHVAASPVMKKIVAEAEKIAKTNANVLITGESGTGKEVIAQLVHTFSQRAARPFIKVNCAAIPETLVESEFFGHEKGSFTGAVALHKGRFELASGGSLLLDEITEVPVNLQAKLLRAIQEQEFERIGGTRPIKVDVRIISTSNRDMPESLAKKKIREDLYYRLNVMPIHIPPLRDRKEDILPLARFFIQKLAQENHAPAHTLSPAAEKALASYSWPGNVRELANVIERAIVLNTSGIIEPGELFLAGPLSKEAPDEEQGKPMTLQELEKKMILETLKKMDHNRTRTAETLGISVRTLRNKLQEYKLEV